MLEDSGFTVPTQPTLHSFLAYMSFSCRCSLWFGCGWFAQHIQSFFVILFFLFDVHGSILDTFVGRWSKVFLLLWCFLFPFHNVLSILLFAISTTIFFSRAVEWAAGVSRAILT